MNITRILSYQHVPEQARISQGVTSDDNINDSAENTLPTNRLIQNERSNTNDFVANRNVFVCVLLMFVLHVFDLYVDDHDEFTLDCLEC